LTFFAALKAMNEKSKIAIFASGSGTNAEEIFKYFKDHPVVEVSLLLSNNAEAYALERAKKFGIPAATFNKKDFREPQIILDRLRDKGVTHIVLAGFLWLIPDHLIKAFPHRIINIHPSLLPNYGGKGMYGMKVHETVKLMQDKETGITIHEVSEKYDEGKILFQAKCVVDASDTSEQIAHKVHQLEYKHYPRVIEQWINEANSR
jgi:phosphoribosylglycinamide formyltransferase 1